ncbi:MAG TPA: TRAP transporter large permease subunit [Gammaproteobacteria bacterium]|nr:TRAP transporter large permease subunit [Xanthomonadales bacterium]MCB1594932.1 TRAP transporter large permease subunit [Xanthomonadales bacterium]HOP21676.1 TRAP transporter large permease subunit [Gammaproteobacteria bacterium]HPI95779.1 TRAP transporter large permease subunit [Gammaproteobacteria bacterium]HPQ87653.1 TRAP transporter large permease subunit [Gammaproteobacteria bacterium]
MEIIWALGLFVAIALALLIGYPVAITLGGVSLWFALAGWFAGWFDTSFLMAMPNRVYGIMTNVTLMAVPVFVFMGLVLEKAKLAESLLENMAALMGKVRGGLGFALLFVGMLLAASTGIVGATVVTLGLLALPVMKKNGYEESLSVGTVCATGTLGQIIPPSIVLVLLGDVLSNAYQQAQIDMGIFSPKTVSVGDLFAGAIIPGLILVLFYALYWLIIVFKSPQKAPAIQFENKKNILEILGSLLPPLLLIVAVLGSILSGFASPTESASVGAVGAMLLAFAKKQLSLSVLMEVGRETVKVTAMVFMILIGAALFSLVFKGFSGDEIVRALLVDLPGGKYTTLFIVMVAIFLLGFILDFIEITFIVIPIIGPILLAQGFDPVWLGIMFAINLQTSFLTPPFGFALFYIKGAVDIDSVKLYKGVIPFIIIQILVLCLLVWQPQLTDLIKF